MTIPIERDPATFDAIDAWAIAGMFLSAQGHFLAACLAFAVMLAIALLAAHWSKKQCPPSSTTRC